MRRPRFVRSMIASLVLVLPPALAVAQNVRVPLPTTGIGQAEPESTIPRVTRAELEALKARVEELPDDDASKKVAQDQIKQIESTQGVDGVSGSWERLVTATTKAEEYARLAAEAPALRDQIRAELAQPAPDPDPNAPADATLTQLEQGLAQANAELRAARTQVTDLQSEATNRESRREVAPGVIADKRQKLAELDQTLQTPLPSETTSIAMESRRLAQRVEREALAKEIQALEAELASYDARRDVLPARKDRAARRVTTAERLVQKWQDLVSRKREEAARAADVAARAALREAARSDPVLADFAERNRELTARRVGTDENPGLIQKIDRTNAKILEAQHGLAQLRAQYSQVIQRIDASGLNHATGLLLRRQYDQLPDVDQLKQELRASIQQQADIEYDRIVLEEERDGAGDISRVVQDLMDEIQVDDPGKREALAAVARDLAEARKELLDTLISDASKYSEALQDLTSELSDYASGAEQYSAYVEERILWVRSISREERVTLKRVRQAVANLTDWDAWQRTVVQTWRGNSGNGLLTIVPLTLGLIGVFTLGRYCRKRVVALTELVSRFKTDKFRYSLDAALFTLVSSLPVPLLFWVLGWLFTRPAEQEIHGLSLGSGLGAAALISSPLMFWWQAVRARGLAEAHLRWPGAAVVAMRTHLRWLVPLLIICSGLVAGIERSGSEVGSYVVGRAAFSIGLLAVVGFFLLTMKPTGPVVGDYLSRNTAGGVARTRYLWFPLLLVIPFSFVVLAWFGWYYTAMQLEDRFEQTVSLVLLLVLIYGLLMRWLFVARRRVAVEDARRRREQAVSDTNKSTTGGEASVPAIDEDKVNLPNISAQTRQVFNAGTLVSLFVGIYLIWASVLPALRMLDRVEVFPHVKIVESSEDDRIPLLEAGGQDVEEVGLPGSPSTEQSASQQQGAQLPTMGVTPRVQASGSGQQGDDQATAQQSVTLADLGMAIVILIATSLAFRNLPGFVEIVVLQRLPLDFGARYALSTVLRYAIAIFGTVVALNAIHLAWSNVQWLAAALTFGLGFGLQEIFANFVSGLIILAERPVRVGDTVTVGGVSGNVTRIRMRATTITDWDRKELVIPNKNFITGDVINWTLSDPILRVAIPVGVGYGEDIRLAEQTLLKVARESDVVLHDPAPNVLFKAFGDSTLDFELRVFIPHIDHFVRIRHDLHMRITEAFREADIEIAFPQRDLHIRSISDVVKLAQPQGTPDPKTSDAPPEEA